MGNEILEIVDIEGVVIGHASRDQFHGNPSLVHRVVHILIFDDAERLLLQKRSVNKDTAPGKWDTSVGGHVNPGEDLLSAAKREMLEELGVSAPQEMQFLYSYLFINQMESELVTTFRCSFSGEINFSEEEIEEVRHWTINEIQNSIGTGLFSGHFEQEFRNYINLFYR